MRWRLSIRILVADDDADFLDVTAYALRRAGFEVSTASNGLEALEFWRADEPDIVLLDVMMPNMTGIEACRTIRSSSATPVVLLGGSRRDSEIIPGFEAGADDFLTKPFSIQQLVMRLQAIHRRSGGHAADVTPKHLVVQNLTIDLDSFGVQLDGRPVQLTRLEFRLLYCLAANADRVVTTPHLIDFAWGLDGDCDSSLLKTHISHIRSKLQGIAPGSVTIRALPGVGYGLRVQPSANVLA